MRCQISLFIHFAFILLFGSVLVAAWGRLGHAIVGRLALELAREDATQASLSLLSPLDIENASSWADNVHHSPPYSWTAPLHYIDLEGEVPFSCGRVPFIINCTTEKNIFCAVQSLAKKISLSNKNASIEFYGNSVPMQHAFMFFLHFVQDMHQPLHETGYLHGGNGIHVKYASHEHTSLHAVWDTLMLQQLIQEENYGSMLEFISSLKEKITNLWKNEKQIWLKCFENKEDCAISWIDETSDLNCQGNVWRKIEKGQDLSKEYYRENIETLRLQLAKAAVRLAYWIDILNAKDIAHGHRQRHESERRQASAILFFFIISATMLFSLVGAYFYYQQKFRDRQEEEPRFITEPRDRDRLLPTDPITSSMESYQFEFSNNDDFVSSHTFLQI